MPFKPETFRPPWHAREPKQQQRKRHDQQRGSAARRSYDHQWRALAAVVKAEEPRCRYCLAEGRVSETQIVDHIIPVRVRPDLKRARSNLQGLCKPCHDGPKKAEELRLYPTRTSRKAI